MSGNETSFRELAIQSQDGGREAYALLLKNLNLFLKNYLRRRLFNQSEIDEVIQETLMAVHRSLHTYDKEKAFMAWLLAITEYKIVDYIRGGKKAVGFCFFRIDRALLFRFFTRLRSED